MNLTSSSIFCKLIFELVVVRKKMKNLPTQERAIKKRVALLKAARYEFSNSGFDVATAKSIAARARVATGTFYQYFENKNDILRVIAENRYAELHEQVLILQNQGYLVGSEIESDSIDDGVKLETFEVFYRVLKFLYVYHMQETELHQVLEQRRSIDGGLNTIMQKGERLMRSIVLKYLSDFELSDPKAVSESLYAMGEGLVHQMVFGDTSSDSETLLKTGATMLASFFSLQNAD